METPWSPEPSAAPDGIAATPDASGTTIDGVHEDPSGDGVATVTDDLVASEPPVGDVDGEDVAHRITVDAVDRVLDEVEQALARLDDGTYATCTGCGGPIDDALLAESPLARTCAGCDAASAEPVPAFS